MQLFVYLQKIQQQYSCLGSPGRAAALFCACRFSPLRYAKSHCNAAQSAAPTIRTDNWYGRLFLDCWWEIW